MIIAEKVTGRVQDRSLAAKRTQITATLQFVNSREKKRGKASGSISLSLRYPYLTLPQTSLHVH